ncbi:unnamed protein product [Durusdinium trenchii]|uniref:Uncharacterized protein n=1 Tax=Durusdinium trenchii TaxID=1381693 RepID=A0ABP0NS41_9DINO
MSPPPEDGVFLYMVPRGVCEAYLEGGRGRETRIYFLSLVPGLTSDDINDEDGFQLDVLHLKKDDGRCGGLPTVENGSGILQDSSGFLARPTSTVLTPCRSSRSYEL